MSFDTDVLIIGGAGPVGMTLANELRRHGVKPRIVDRASGIREVSKAMILHVRTQEVLDKVGITERVRREAKPLTEVVVHAYGKHIGSWDLDEIDSPYKHPLIIGQNRTQHALLGLMQSRGADIEWGRAATALTLDSEGATTEITSGDGASTVIRSRYVVGCEGSNSLVRRALNLSFAGERYSGEPFIQADCRIKWALPRGRSYLFLTAVGYIMVIEFPDGIVRIFISLPDADADSSGAREAAGQLGAVESATEQPTLDEIRHHLTRLSGFDCQLSDAGWLARYRTSHRYANRFSQGRAFIAGDAAHVHVPIGGQGMNTGVQDAFNLGWKLAGVCKGELQEKLLDSYDDERHPVAEALIRGTNFAYTGILHPSEARQRAARLFGPFLIRSGIAQDFMRNTLEELRVFYPDSLLNLDLGGGTGPRPGERVLDVEMGEAVDMRSVSLNELTRDESWTLLLFGGAHGTGDPSELSPLAAEVTEAVGARVKCRFVIADRKAPSALNATDVLLDALHMADKRYGIAGPSFYLLPPDTYVAARGPLSAASRLLPYLRSVFA